MKIEKFLKQMKVNALAVSKIKLALNTQAKVIKAKQVA